MRLTTTFAAAAALTLSGFAANAGGLNDEIMEAPVVMEEPMMEAAPAGSISPTIIVVGILAALLLAANLGEEEADDLPPV